MRILVTGATGGVGRLVVDEAAQRVIKYSTQQALPGTAVAAEE